MTKNWKICLCFIKTQALFLFLAPLQAQPLNAFVSKTPLYWGVDNEIKITVPGIPDHLLDATAAGGTIQRSGDKWLALPEDSIQELTITVTATIAGKTRMLASFIYNVTELPPPRIYFLHEDKTAYRPTVSYRDSTLLFIQKEKVLQAEKMVLRTLYPLVDYDIERFDIFILDPLGTSIYLSDGGSFSEKQKEFISSVPVGNSFYISNIKYKSSDSINRKWYPLKMQVR